MQTNNIGFLLTDIIRLMRREYSKSDLCMTPMQARALVYVSRYEGVKQVQLAEMLDIQPITLARLIDQLAEDRLIERRPDPKDRRAYGLYLMEKSTPLLEKIDIEVTRVHEKALQGLSEEQVAVLRDALAVMHTNLSADSSL
ncbi:MULTISPECIES: MarR family winged helix-turn-helix transcriptional regulator [Marinomonas]|uniref:MarR family transcriptional regulator n=1 Tax=Marinomonas arctica TaxID=383750 RepID=A0A7H1J6Q0_9GAMM|nr:MULTISPECIES: MarR family transcriptional regulator [Marinomonas]MCS7485141.1 MarR family transcriptional regulator [Marinomonas sp. BSi20414]QNT06166.1 MarR family transcriptional regulator [Marinomonas arctica]GGN18267.1 MarR family transcriptional regulator [Marinomonas arctica]